MHEQFEAVSRMSKNVSVCIATLALALSSCAPMLEDAMTPVMTETPEHLHYTDAEIERLLAQFHFLNSDEVVEPAPENALEQPGIDPDELGTLDRRVGDCYDMTAYDLSPTYVLLVDRNVCFGLRVWIERKDGSG